jgi:hypothetical protein
VKDYTTDDTGLVVTDVVDFVKRPLPPRTYLLSPWLTKESMSMIYAQTGVGKTHLTLNIAHALATGGEFLGWKAEKPVKVLYVDAEMAMDDLQGRLKAIIRGTGKEPEAGFFKHIARSEQFEGYLPNLFTSDGQKAFSDHFKPFDVIILDNLSALVTGSSENEAEGWEPIQQWAIKERAKGKTIIFIHHAGKNASQRGTSKRTDLMDVVIKLERKSDYIPEEGALFRVVFDKARSLYGKAVAPFTARLTESQDCGQQWMRVDGMADDEDIDEIRQLRTSGMTMAEIGQKLGIDKATVSRKLKRALEGAEA